MHGGQMNIESMIDDQLFHSLSMGLAYFSLSHSIPILLVCFLMYQPNKN